LADSFIAKTSVKNLHLPNADFSSSELYLSDFSSSNFSGCDFSRCEFDQVDLSNSKLDHCSFNKSRMFSTNFENSDLSMSDFSESDVSVGVHMRTGEFNSSSLDIEHYPEFKRESKFKNAVFSGTVMEDVNLHEIQDLSKVQAEGIVWTNFPPVLPDDFMELIPEDVRKKYFVYSTSSEEYLSRLGEKFRTDLENDRKKYEHIKLSWPRHPF
jgi:hypothetical protein